MENETKLRDLDFGKFAEEKATEFYIARGYAIRERNWRFKRIEIDLIAQTGDTVVFVEVKARSGRDTDPLDAVTPDKIRRMVRGADIYLKSLDGELEYRFDIFALTGDFSDYRVEVYEDAFLAPLM